MAQHSAKIKIDMREKLFEIGKNWLKISEEYSFSESESFFIKENFWPIIVVNSYDTEWVKNQLDYYKLEFIKENKIFDLDIFKRNNLDFLVFELNEYLDNIKKGKTKIWTERKGDYFHWFKLHLDTKSYTLLISDKNEIQLEIYFKTLLSEILKFIEAEQVLPIRDIETITEQETPISEQETPITEQETPITLSDVITHANSVEIVERVKVQYKNIKGKRLKLLLLAFQDLNLLPKERIANKFHKCCEKEFDWEIASYTAMNGHKFNEVTDSVEFTSMKQYLETLIKTN
ncbi:hypothetical protein [Flavobacterium sp. K5-23]|uniref:hypothetical protein n=1 Tax=Flavobacterium sp. K5-23 TaxID=2746225 RepID=UPI002010166D|nr:hypothetical protein [Flavobacterium sp. K5-23]